MSATNTQSFLANDLPIYRVFAFSLTTTKGGKSGSAKAYITIVDYDMSTLTVNWPEELYITGLDMNEQIEMQSVLAASANPDNMKYTLGFVYQNLDVAAKNANYSTFRFRLEEHYRTFTWPKNVISVRVSVLDTAYFMPSSVELAFSVNIPPTAGTITVSPLSGYSVTTAFTIEAKGFIDINRPLSYRYSYYFKEQDYYDEMNSNLDPYKMSGNIIQDFAFADHVSTKFPRADYASGYYKILVLVQVADALGGQQNLTQLIEVQPQPVTIQQHLLNIQGYIATALTLSQMERLRLLVTTAQEIAKLDQVACPLCSNNGICDAATGTCACDEGKFLRDCSANEIEFEIYRQLKLTLYSILWEEYGNLNSCVLQEQVWRAMVGLLQDKTMFEILTQAWLEQGIANVSQLITSYGSQLTTLQGYGVLKRGDPLFSRQEVALERSLRSCDIFLDALMLAVNRSAVYNSWPETFGRVLGTPIETYTYMEVDAYLKQLMALMKQVSQIQHTQLLPNELQISHMGTFLQKRTTKKTALHTLNDVLDIENHINTINPTSPLQNIEGDGVWRIYDIIEIGYKSNPFWYQKQYDYTEQLFRVEDVDICRTGTTTQITLNVPIKLRFQVVNLNQMDWNFCVARKQYGAWDPPGWYADICKTIIETSTTGDKYIVCHCYELLPTTVISDEDCKYRNCEV